MTGPTRRQNARAMLFDGRGLYAGTLLTVREAAVAGAASQTVRTATG